LSYCDVEDPIEMRQRLAFIADTNTKVFFEVFMCEPDNSIKSFKDVVKVREEKERYKSDTANFIQNYEQRWREIKGHVVNYPMDYLMEEDLNTNLLS